MILGFILIHGSYFPITICFVSPQYAEANKNHTQPKAGILSCVIKRSVNQAQYWYIICFKVNQLRENLPQKEISRKKWKKVALKKGKKSSKIQGIEDAAIKFL